MAALPPSFPKGLRVLLVDTEHSRSLTSSQLRQPELQYAVTTCTSSTEALAHCTAGTSAFDVVLAESKLVAADELTGRAFIEAFDDTPVVLMSEGGDANDVLRAVTLGAVDFMEKPLSVLKLKNIWQHSVRRMMQRTSLYESSYFGGEAQTYSEPLLRQSSGPVPSISDCLPSTLTGPVGLAHPSNKLPSYSVQHRSSVDSPGTPSASDADPVDSFSAGSVRQRAGSFSCLTARTSCETDRRASYDSVDGEDDASVGAPAAKRAAPQPRPPLACKPSSFGPLMPVPPVSQWPQLAPGCVWGTPVGGPLPPLVAAPPASAPAQVAWNGPAAAAAAAAPGVSHLHLNLHDSPLLLSAPAPVIIRSAPAAPPPPAAPLSLSFSSACDRGGLPEGFLATFTKGKGGPSGPLGLKLRKSSSLLDLINSSLGSSAAPNA